MLERFRRKQRGGEKIYGASALFIGVRGVVSWKRLDVTVAIFQGGRVSTKMFRGWRFLQEFEILLVESDRRSQPASPRG
jgi:hypothetical protein